jgi:hypothetical protein
MASPRTQRYMGSQLPQHPLKTTFPLAIDGLGPCGRAPTIRADDYFGTRILLYLPTTLPFCLGLIPPAFEGNLPGESGSDDLDIGAHLEMGVCPHIHHMCKSSCRPAPFYRGAVWLRERVHL